jgi:hypothetical protein
MKMRMCSCRWSALVRPTGDIRVKKTKLASNDVLVADLEGTVKGKAAVVKLKKDFYFVPPKGYGEARKVPADYLTDGLHTAIFNMEMDMKEAGPKAVKPPVKKEPMARRHAEELKVADGTKLAVKK